MALLKSPKIEMAGYLDPFPWEMIVAQNEFLCRSKSAFHGPTSDGYEVVRQKWEHRSTESDNLMGTVQFLRECHRLAPFCFYNGNTFVSVAQLIVRKLSLPPEEAYVLRSLVGHIVAGVSTGEEEAALAAFSDSLEEE